jgi:hypothetical protein
MVNVQIAPSATAEADGFLMSLAPLSQDTFAEAVVSSVRASKVFAAVVSAETAAQYRIDVEVLTLQYQPEAVEMVADWRLSSLPSEELIHRKKVTATSVLSVGQHFLGNTRMRAMLEEASKKNILAGLSSVAGALEPVDVQ